MPSAITTDGLSKRYRDVAALADLTLDVPAGSVFGFLGQNGAGKSTALRILAGLARATAGSATVDGIPVDVQGAHRSRIGYLAQDPRFYGWMTGRQTLEHVARFRDVGSRRGDGHQTHDGLEGPRRILWRLHAGGRDGHREPQLAAHPPDG